MTPPTDSDFNATLDRALRFLAQRPRSEYEVWQRLSRPSSGTSARRARSAPDQATIKAVLARLKLHGLVDDAQFARYWVEQRQTFRPRGARLLRAELRQHGVASPAAEAAAEGIQDTAEDDAYRAASKRARQLGATLDERTFKTRLSQFLARRGFDWDTIAPVIDRLWREVRTY
jgi:regulatory protein